MEIYISPKEKETFMRDLAAKQPELVFEMDRVVRKSTYKCAELNPGLITGRRMWRTIQQRSMG